MSAFNKLWGSIAGSVIGMLIAFLAVHIPSISTCADMADTATCSTLGLSTAQISAASVALFAWLGTVLSPSNKAT